MIPLFPPFTYCLPVDVQSPIHFLSISVCLPGKTTKMIGPNFMDEIDCGSFFDHIDDLLEFPSEDVSGGLMAGDCNSFPSIWTTPSDTLPGPDSVFSGPNSNSNSDLSAELSVPVSLPAPCRIPITYGRNIPEMNWAGMMIINDVIIMYLYALNASVKRVLGCPHTHVVDVFSASFS